MAWTEKYVDLAGSGTDSGTVENPYLSFGSAVTGIGTPLGAPTKVYVRGNGSLSGALSFSNDGTTAYPLLWIGCTGTGATWTPIGDDASASKPTLTCSTYQVAVTGDYNWFENIAFTGAVTTSSGLVSNTSAGLWATFVRCRFTNTASNANACAITLGAMSSVCYGCFMDCVATGTAPTQAVRIATGSSGVIGCHVRGGESNISSLAGGLIAFCILEACNSNSAITGDTAGTWILNNTITGAGADGIRQTTAVGWVVVNNLIHSATGVAINNSSAADNFGLRCFNNMFYNCGTAGAGNLVDGTPENMAWGSVVASADPLPNLAEPASDNNDFDLAYSQRGLAFPGVFEAGAYAFTGYMDHGALQRQEDYPTEAQVQSGVTFGGQGPTDDTDALTGTLSASGGGACPVIQAG